VSFQNADAMHSFGRVAAVFLMLAIIVSSPLLAQVAGGTLTGVVTDPSGAGIPDAKVMIRNVATGVERVVSTNSDGIYVAVNILPGTYLVKFNAPGFNTETKADLTMTVGAQQTLDIAMRVGTVSNRVEVTSEVPPVQLQSSDISAVVNATTVRELPLNGRSWTDLAALQPGVDTIQTQPSFATGADRGNRGFGQQLTISGARPQQNNYRLDGVSLNDYANGAPGSVLGGNLGVDAIQEFSVLTSNYSAEYGKTSGGVVNAVTRSGTNDFHGSAYEFLRNSALDAKNYFEAANAAKATFKRNQFGGAIGGPIFKDKTFFFADYEGIRQSKGIANLNFVPSAAARAGNIHDTNSGAPLTVSVDPEIQKYLALYPVPADCGSDVCPFIFNGKQVVTENFFTTRIDHRFSEKDSIFGTYLYDKTPYDSPDPFGNVGLRSLSSRQIVAVEETHNFTPSVANALRFGYNHERVDNNSSVKAINPAAADTSLAAFEGRNAAVVSVNGILSTMTGGVGGLPTYLYRWNSYQIYDDAFWSKGKHSIKFGGAFERMPLQVTALTDPNGIWFFNNLQNFLTNAPAKFQGGVASSLTPRNLRQSIFGAYIQDDWRWKSNVTLNLGLRYEMATVPTETDGKIANLRNLSDPLPVCGVVVTGCASKGSFFDNPTLHNFEPRLGFSWDPLKTGRLAIRGGVGLFDVLPLPYQFILLTTQSAPFFQYTALKVGDPTLPVPLTFPLVDPANITANKLRSTYVESHPHRNYVTQWNLNVQYGITQSLTAMLAYVGSRGVHQPFRVDEADLVIPTKTSAGYLWPKVDVLGNVWGPGCMATDPNASDGPQCAPPNTINPAFGSVRGMFYQGRSYYNALEAQVAKRMSHGFQVQGTFTWAKSIDTSSATLAGDAFGNSISSLNWFDMKLTRGLSDFNVGRTLVLNGTWELPDSKWSGPAKWLTNGWQLGLIFTVSDGVPFTPTWGTGGDPAGTLSSDDFAYPNRLHGAGCGSATNPGNPTNYIRTQCFGVPVAPNQAFFDANCDPAPPTYIDPNTGSPGPLPAGDLRCFNLRGNAGRNVLTGPGITNLDFSVFKNNRITRISENFNVQFRMEIFNIMNHPNFAPPGPGDGNTDIFAPDGSSLTPPGGTSGVLLRTTIPERQIQFALKVSF
jgi:Carboxypeptidase regulatory-like domain/TonB dependent receptor/TonB-dependent Receptor Plug Domain